MTVTPLRRRLDRLEKVGSSWRAYENTPADDWPDWALDARIRESRPDMFAGRPADEPITDDELRQIIADEDAALKQSYPEVFAGRLPDAPVTEEDLWQIVEQERSASNGKARSKK